MEQANKAYNIREEEQSIALKKGMQI